MIDRSGRTVAAIGVSASAARVTAAYMVRELFPPSCKHAVLLGRMLQRSDLRVIGGSDAAREAGTKLVDPDVVAGPIGARGPDLLAASPYTSLLQTPRSWTLLQLRCVQLTRSHGSLLPALNKRRPRVRRRPQQCQLRALSNGVLLCYAQAGSVLFFVIVGPNGRCLCELKLESLVPGRPAYSSPICSMAPASTASSSRTAAAMKLKVRSAPACWSNG